MKKCKCYFFAVPKYASSSLWTHPPHPVRGRKLFCELCAFLRQGAGSLPFFAILVFAGALFWAKQNDPFLRKWFMIKTADGVFVKCVAVLPKTVDPCRVVIYAHPSGGKLMNDGFHLRKMAEMGLAAVSLEYNQNNEVSFDNQFDALLQYIVRQKWVDTNAVAWVGFNLGANRILNFALLHPEKQPRLIILLGGAGLSEEADLHVSKAHRIDLSGTFSPSDAKMGHLHCRVLLIHVEQHEVFPMADTKRMATVLQSSGVPVELKVVSGMVNSAGADAGSVFRCIGEYCLTHLASNAENGKQKAESNDDVWQKYCSLAQRQAETPPLWLFWLPAAAWVVGRRAWWKAERRSNTVLSRKPITRGVLALRWLAAFLAIWGLADTALHVVPPRLSVSERTLGIARNVLVEPKEVADFEFLARQSIWQGEKLNTLLTHVELASYNRELINWRLDDETYRNFVLSPAITGMLNESLDWRRLLWEEFYPRIRRESSAQAAAEIVVRHLRECVTIAHLPNPSREVPEIWLRQVTDEAGFEIIYVAALRSVGVPARLDANCRAEFFDSSQWRAAPSPAVVTW